MPGKEVHVFCAGYRADEFEELLRYADHIVFNSPSQLLRLEEWRKRQEKAWDFESIRNARPRRDMRFMTLVHREARMGYNKSTVG